MTRTELFEQIGAATEDDALKILSLLFYKTIPVTADLDPDDIPGWQNVLDVVAGVSSSAPVEFPFTDSATIEWQTDIAPDTGVTFAVYFGNILPKMMAYSGNDADGYDSNTPTAHVTRSSGVIGEVSFNMPGDWVIVF